MKGAPRSEIFDDVYFSAQNGLEETRHVFLDGNHLPQNWQNRDEFTICETGFGTGLNFLAAWRLFKDSATAAQRLNYISFEKYPLSTADVQEALSPWLAEFSDELPLLLTVYPALFPGFHKIIVNTQVSLLLIFEDVNDALLELQAQVDCWFLDGFRPATNPDMWSDTVFEHMARLSTPGTSFATFTAAGFVRRGLEAAGFAVEKVPGYGTKREMLTGRLL